MWFAYADEAGKLWYVPDDPASEVHLARVEITDAAGTQQSGTAVSIRF